MDKIFIKLPLIFKGKIVGIYFENLHDGDFNLSFSIEYDYCKMKEIIEKYYNNQFDERLRSSEVSFKLNEIKLFNFTCSLTMTDEEQEKLHATNFDIGDLQLPFSVYLNFDVKTNFIDNDFNVLEENIFIDFC